MRKDSALALVVLCVLLALQPFLYRGYGPAWSALPIAVFALVMLYFVLRPKPVEFHETDEPAPGKLDEARSPPAAAGPRKPR